MPDLPALPLGDPQIRARRTRRSPRPRLTGPGTDAQRHRLGPEFARLTRAFEAGRLSVADEPAALAPEQVLVLDVAGELRDFARALRRISGLEFIAEEAEETAAADEEFAAVGPDGRRHPYKRHLYLMMSDATAWSELLGLWERFQRGEPFRAGLTVFRDLFERLRSLRAWNDADRLEHTGALDAWKREFSDLGDELVDFEIELWLRRDMHRRERTIAELRAQLESEEVGGEFVAHHVHEEISYHGVLGRAPARLLLDAVAHHEVRWIRTDAVRFFRATGQVAAVDSDERAEISGPVAVEARPLPAGEPRVALLDGVPLAGHELLAGRLAIDDPAGLGALTPAARRLHGTAMASIVVHGDLNAPDTAHTRPLYVRPLVAAQAPDWVRDAREELPRDRLAVDLIHEAVARLFEGEEAAREVKIIVLALGDTAAQFDRFISPLARLLDWLAFRYGVLFIVSAGNHPADIELAPDVVLENLLERQHEVLCALQRTVALRRLLSPAEAVNALTIGAAHTDSSDGSGSDDRLDPLLDGDLPSVLSALGPGVRMAVKPDMLLPGGRQLIRLAPASDGRSRRANVSPSRRPPGVRVASPASRTGLLDATAHGTGTSMAAALGGHHAGHLLDALDALRDLHGDAMPPAVLDAVLVKALLAHEASWHVVRKPVEDAQKEVLGRSLRDAVSHFVGYGRADPTHALICNEHRVTALAAGYIADGQAHAYRLPLPPSLAATTAERRLTLTLACLTPINPEHRAYRRAALTIEPSDGPKLVTDRSDVTSYPSRRGTLEHVRLAGSRALPFAPGSALELTVSCRADAGPLTVSVPYAVVVTLEVPQELRLPIYEEVRQALRVPIDVRAGGR